MKKTFEEIVTAEFIDGQIISVLSKLNSQVDIFQEKMIGSEELSSYEIKKLKQEIEETVEELNCCVEVRCKKDTISTKIKDALKSIKKK